MSNSQHKSRLSTQSSTEGLAGAANTSHMTPGGRLPDVADGSGLALPSIRHSLTLYKTTIYIM